MKGYSFFSHTADMGMHVSGRTRPELFKNAALGLFTYLSVPIEKTTRKKYNISVSGIDTESLLVNWLNELIYLSSKENSIFTEFKIFSFCRTSFRAEVSGANIFAGKYLLREIKAATYHNLKIVKDKNIFSAKIFFDL